MGWSRATSTATVTIQVNGKTLAYTVTAGTMLLKEEDQKEGEKSKASIFYIAYELDGVENSAERPITFSFHPLIGRGLFNSQRRQKLLIFLRQLGR